MRSGTPGTRDTLAALGPRQGRTRDFEKAIGHMAQIIDGKLVAAEVRGRAARLVDRVKARPATTPGLAVVLVGDDPASHSYVRMKEQDCAEVGHQIGRYPAPRRRDAGRAQRHHRGVQRGSDRPRNPRAVPATRSPRRGGRPRADQPREGRRRAPSREHGTARSRHPSGPRLHPMGRHGDARPLRHRPGGQASGRHRPVVDRRQADGAHAARAPRDRHRLPQPDA